MHSKVRNSTAQAPRWQLSRVGHLAATIGLVVCGGCADTLSSCHGRLSRINSSTPVHVVSRVIAGPASTGAP